jgi:hypothetical protein
VNLSLLIYVKPDDPDRSDVDTSGKVVKMTMIGTSSE